MRLLARELVRGLDDLGHAGHAANENELVDVGLGKAGVFEARLKGLYGLFDERIGELFELRAREPYVQVLGAGGVGGDERKVYVGLLRGGKGDLRLFGLLFQTLERHRVVAQVYAVFLFEVVDEPVHYGRVEIVAAELRVAVGRLDFKHAVSDFENRNIVCAAAKVVDRDGFVVLLVEPVGQRRRGGLVYDSAHVQARDGAGILGRLPLRVVKVCGNRYDGLRDGLAQIRLGVGLQMLENHRRNLFRRKALRLVAYLALYHGGAVGALHDFVRKLLCEIFNLGEFAAYKPLGRENGVARIRDGLALGRLPHEPLAGLGESHDRRGCPSAFPVRDNGALSAFHDRHARVRSS